MLKINKKLTLLFVFSLNFAINALADSPTTTVNQNKSVGDVHLKISCSDGAQRQFNHALALSHHMMYVQAQQVYNSIRNSEPECAMAHWGIAFTNIHPLWSDSLSVEQLNEGRTLLDKANALKPLNQLEQGLINALGEYYNGSDITDNQRFANWEKAQYALYQKHSDHPEAIALYALLHLATAPKSDKTFQHQKDAGLLLEALNKKHPKHPAGYHYTIHAYDNPLLAKRGEFYARKYDEIAPDVPHALHMPTHIFVRLGLWPETISWNIRSAKAAKSQPMPDGAESMHYAHALDYLMYAYLQQQKFAEAKDVLEQVHAIENIQPIFAAGYGLAAARARFYLEQNLWEEAAKLELTQPSSYPWQKFPAALSIIHFAKGVGAVQSGDLKMAKQMVGPLHHTYKTLHGKGEKYWSVLALSKLKTLQAWILVKEQQLKKALPLMLEAADLEDSVDKHPVTPSEILPARELYGDLLMLNNQPDDALKAYQQNLTINPNRYKSIKGALEASQALNDQENIKRYKNMLTKLTS